MKVYVYFDNNSEHFAIEGQPVSYPLGKAFIDIIGADFFGRDVLNSPLIDENPLLAPFKIDVKNISEETIKLIAEYQVATHDILDIDNEYFKDFDIHTRFMLHKKYIKNDFANEMLLYGYMCHENNGTQLLLPDPNNLPVVNTIEELYKNISLIAKNIKASASFLEVFEINNIEQGLYISFMKMIENKVKVKKCKCCKKYFIPTGRIDTEYCNRVAPNSTKTCKEIGAIKKYHDKNKGNTIIEEFQKQYKKMNSRVRIKKITQDSFYNWSEKARALRDKAINENMSFNDFKKELAEMEV